MRNTVEASVELGVQYLTLYAFSTENWKRPKIEIEALMSLLITSLHSETKKLHENNIRLTAIGNLDSLPKKVYANLMDAVRYTKNNKGLTLILALSYSARWEIINAVKSLTKHIHENNIPEDQINSALFSSFLTTSSIPDPELLIRTSGEFRISNFLLWQIAYAELYFTDTLWPDFCKEDLYEAIYSYQQRERRFGLTSEQIKHTG